LELSPSKWLVTSLVSGTDKLSKHLVPGGDCGALLQLLAALKAKAEKQSGTAVVVATIQEAGLDGFSLHRLLEANGAESWIVDPSSVAAPRRARRAKSDAIDGETLLRTLLAYRRGEPRVCSMVHPTSPHDEDRRRLTRERRTLMRERIEHTNRIKGLLMSQGISGYDPLRKNALYVWASSRREMVTVCRPGCVPKLAARLIGSNYWPGNLSRSRQNATR
jgi:transposase